MRSLSNVLLAAFAGLLAISPMSQVRAAMVEYSAGHGDIGLAIETDGSLHIHYHFGDGAIIDGSPLNVGINGIEYSASEAYVRVGDAGKLSAPGPLAQLGVNTGDDVWIIADPEVTGVPYLGLAGEELSAPYTDPRFQLIGFNYIGTGSGNFALWQPGPFGGLDFKMISNDGIDASDVFLSSIGGHAHANWGFSSAGVYELRIQGSVLDGSGNLLTDEGVFTFVVGSATAVPEPGTLGLLAMSSVVGGWYARRRKKVAVQA